MKFLLAHITRSMIAGIVALLPIGGTILGFVWIEGELAAFWKSFPALEAYYFPGLGILGACACIYAVGLVVSTFVGKVLIKVFDELMDAVPLLGPLYRSLKQILGYGEGRDAIFERVVWMRSREHDSEELALVTRELEDEAGILLFVPGSPNPASGRLICAQASMIRPAQLSVHEALKSLVALGKIDLEDGQLLDKRTPGREAEPKDEPR